MGEENLQFFPDGLKNPMIFLIKSFFLFIQPNVVLIFFNILERTSHLLAKEVLEWQRSNQVSVAKEEYKSAEEWI